MFNMEQAYLTNRRLTEIPLNDAEEKAYEIYLRDPRMIERRKENISMADMDDFSDKYSQVSIDKDKQWLKGQKGKDGQMEKTQRAELFEYFIETVAESADWFGENAYLTNTSEFDDRMNHTDFILEWEGDDGKTTKLAIDCTLSEDEEVLKKKLGRVLSDIDAEKMTSIKYFQSSGTDERGSLNLIPRVILSLEKEGLKEICQMLVDAKSKVPGSNKKLSESYIQLYFLEEMVDQLEVQAEYLQKNKFRKYGFMKNNIVGALNCIKQVLKEKEGSLGQDSVQRAHSKPSATSPFLQSFS